MRVRVIVVVVDKPRDDRATYVASIMQNFARAVVAWMSSCSPCPDTPMKRVVKYYLSLKKSLANILNEQFITRTVIAREICIVETKLQALSAAI